MYLQITTKCNMTCEHCAFSCTNRGRHMKDWKSAVSFAADNDSHVTIGGGEPTLHPEFFDILKECLETFDHVFIATNGSQTNAMWRLSAIIDDDDIRYLSEDMNIKKRRDESEDEYYERLDGLAYGLSISNSERKLHVDLSTDYYHDRDMVNDRIWEHWKARSKNRNNGFGLRDVTQSSSGVADTGRARKNGLSWSDHCVCSDFIIKPNGKIKLCGCEKSPIIGDIYNGISETWEKRLDNDNFNDARCFKSLKKGA